MGFFPTEQVEAEVGAYVQPAPLLLFHSKVGFFSPTEQVEAEVRKFNLPPVYATGERRGQQTAKHSGRRSQHEAPSSTGGLLQVRHLSFHLLVF